MTASNVSAFPLFPLLLLVCFSSASSASLLLLQRASAVALDCVSALSVNGCLAEGHDRSPAEPLGQSQQSINVGLAQIGQLSI